MLRVFLVIDDYNELIYLQTLLKKIGFDVEGLQNQRKYADLSLGFNPQILITSLNGAQVDGLLLAQGIHKLRGLPKIIALKSGDHLISQDEAEQAGIDMVLDSPINAKRLLLGIATLGNLDENALLEKYAKIKGQVEAPVQSYSSSGLSDDSDSEGEGEEQQILSFNDRGEAVEEVQKQKPEKAKSQPVDFVLPQGDAQRTKRFEENIQEMGPLDSKKFDRNRIREFNKTMRSWPVPDDIDEIDDEKVRFVKALFKK